MESSIMGVSVRAIIAMFVVVMGYIFAFAVVFLIGGENIVSAALSAVITWTGLVLGFYFGQKTMSPPDVIIERREDGS